MKRPVIFRPYRPRAIRLVNAIGRGLAVFGIQSRLDADALIEAARRKTGLEDFGDEFLLDALRVLTRSIDEEANLHPFGRWVVRNRLLDALKLRLKIQALVTRHPDILKQQITAPLVIAGLQRTGTTMLHRLLAADPDSRALLSWEAINPIRPDNVVAGQPDPRIKAARMAENGLKYLAPEFFKIHPVEAEAPEEDVLLLENSFMSQVPEAMYRVPSYAAWLAQQDHRPAYEYLKLMLQLIQWQDIQQGQQPRRWVLKTPAHLEQMDVLLKVFPDARIIQTHRDPMKTVGSYSSMLAHGQGVFTDQVDAQAIARHWLLKNAAALKKTQQVRTENPQAFVDVYYEMLMRDPQVEVEQVYRFAGIEMTAEARAAMQAAQQSNRKDKHGRHRYRLEDFGLDEQQVREAYADYLSAFDIPVERKVAA